MPDYSGNLTRKVKVLDFIKSGGLEEGQAQRDGDTRRGRAEEEFAYTTGYDSHGRVSVNRLVDERDCAVMLTKPDPDAAGPVLPGTGA